MSGRKKEPVIYVIESKWKGTSHAWTAHSYLGGEVAGYDSEKRADKEIKRLRTECSMFAGMPTVYRLVPYLRAAVK